MSRRHKASYDADQDVLEVIVSEEQNVYHEDGCGCSLAKAVSDGSVARITVLGASAKDADQMAKFLDDVLDRHKAMAV